MTGTFQILTVLNRIALTDILDVFAYPKCGKIK